MDTITIIGGGFSGIAVLLQLLQQHDGRELSVNIIEKRTGEGIGIAYSTCSENHLLNVPAGKMGAFPSDIEHFIKWLQAAGYSYSATDFVPRMIYAKYLRSILDEAMRKRSSSFNVNHINDEAVSLEQISSGYAIKLKGGNTISSGKVVLALGNFPPSHPYVKDMAYIESDRYLYNPWSTGILENLSENDKILIIGTGLTMIDMIADLHKSDFKGEIVAISRHGYVPFVHKFTHPYSSFYDELKECSSIQDVYNIIQKHRKLARLQNVSWRGVVDSLRPHTQQLWQNLSLNERKKFLRHLNSLWSVLRHRIPPSSQEAMMEMKRKEQLKIYPAKLMKLIASQNNIHVVFRIRKTRQVLAADFNYVFNCTGPHSNYARIKEPLVQDLRAKGIIQPDPLNLGLNATTDCRIIDKDGNISETLFTLGPAMKGILGESTAVPEIRLQAEMVARMLLGK